MPDGTFDLIGQSHNIHHMFVVLGIYLLHVMLVNGMSYWHGHDVGVCPADGAPFFPLEPL